MDLGVGGTQASQMEQIEALCEVKPNVFAGGLGMSQKVVEKCHLAGAKVISSCGYMPGIFGPSASNPSRHSRDKVLEIGPLFLWHYNFGSNETEA